MQKESIYDRMTNAEKVVADALKELGVEWRYEQPVFVWDEQGRPRVWAPDFYLVQFGIYVDVCGSDNFDYSYRKKIFSQNGYQVIFLHLFKNAQLWKRHFLRYLVLFINSRRTTLTTLLSG